MGFIVIPIFILLYICLCVGIFLDKKEMIQEIDNLNQQIQVLNDKMEYLSE